MPQILISHTDLDGVTCQLLFRVAYPDAVIYGVDYAQVASTVRTAAEALRREASAGGSAPLLVVTDLDLTEEICAYLTEIRLPALVLDHHPRTADLARRFTGHPALQIVHSPDRCGAWMLYEHLLQTAPGGARETLMRYGDLVKLVSDYDLWIHSDPRSLQLNRLFHLLGADRFVRRFLANPEPAFTDAEQLLLEVEAERVAAFLEVQLRHAEVQTDPDGMRYVVAFADRYQSELGAHLIRQLQLDYVIMLDPTQAKASVRSASTFDAARFAARYRVGSVQGGGHPRAAGFPLMPEVVAECRMRLIQPSAERTECRPR